MMTWISYQFNYPSSYSMEIVYLVHDYACIILVSVVLLVLLMIIDSLLCRNFFLHFYEDHSLEYLWTVVPFLILLFIAGPSLFTLYFMDSCLFCGPTVKITGNQWYWRYNYGSDSALNFDSYITNEDRYRLLGVDNRVVLPFGIPSRVLVTSGDVIHSWTIPSIGVKVDAVPGRLSQSCFTLFKPGKFFGQCSEICGSNHSFMPINLESVKFDDFANCVS